MRMPITGMKIDTLSTDSDSFVVTENSSRLDFSIKVVLALDEWGELQRILVCSVLCLQLSHHIYVSCTDTPQVRRFRLRHLTDAETGAISLETLLAKLKEVAPEDTASSFLYEDGDGDNVSVTTDRELMDAIQESMDTGILMKLIAVAPKKATDHGTQAQGTLLTDPVVTDRILTVMNTSDLDPLVYKGNLVGAANKLVLTHLVDEFQSHVTSGFAPPRTFGPNIVGKSIASFTYIINGESHASKYFAIDGIYLDLTKKYDKEDSVKLFFPRLVYNKLHHHVLANHPIWGHPVTTDELQESSACIDHENPPAFVVFQKHLDGQGNATGGMVARNEGLLTDVMESEDHKHLYKITGIFTCERDQKSVASIHFIQMEVRLVGMRVFSIHDDILKKINITNATLFGS
jgi:PB1 domain